MSSAPRRLGLRRPALLGALVAAAAVLALPVAASSAVVAPLPATIPAACGMLDLADPAAVVANAVDSEDVFIGRVVDLTPGATVADPIVHGVEVEDALSGDLRPGQPVRVVFTVTGSEPTQLRLNQNYVFFTSGVETTLQADGCDGYASARTLDAAQVEALREALVPAEEPPAVVLSEPEGGSDDAPDLGRVVAPGAAISLIGVLGLALISRVGRRRR